MKDTYIQIFFIISSVGFVTLWILTAIMFIYLIRMLHRFDRISQKLEKGVETMSDDLREIIDDIRMSSVFNFFLGKKKTTRKK